MTWNEAKNTLELNRPFAYSELKEAVDMAIKAIEENQQYKELGTVKELQVAKEKQTLKKCIIDEYCGFTSFECPICKHEIEAFDCYCRNCGQKIRKTIYD